MYRKELEKIHQLRNIATSVKNPPPSRELDYFIGEKSGIKRFLYLLSGENF